MITLVRMVRWWARALTTTRSRPPGPIGKLWRGALLVPVFGGMLILLRARLWLIGALPFEATTRFGAHMHCRLPDLIQMYIALFGVWEPDLTRLIDDRLVPGDRFIDVGANVGYYSLLAASRVGPDGGVVAIDALPSNYDDLLANLQRNADADRVRALNRAVAEEQGTLTVYAGPGHNLGLATTAPGRRGGLLAAGEVAAAPLAALLEADEIRGARLLKIDVEGSEPGVLAGLDGFLRECRDDLEILVELSPAWWDDPALTPEAAVRPLREAGFHSYAVANNYWPWRYLWPDAVTPPQRIRRLPDARVRRLDLIFSRVDVSELV